MTAAPAGRIRTERSGDTARVVIDNVGRANALGEPPSHEWVPAVSGSRTSAFGTSA